MTKKEVFGVNIVIEVVTHLIVVTQLLGIQSGGERGHALEPCKVVDVAEPVLVEAEDVVLQPLQTVCMFRIPIHTNKQTM